MGIGGGIGQPRLGIASGTRTESNPPGVRRRSLQHDACGGGTAGVGGRKKNPLRTSRVPHCPWPCAHKTRHKNPRGGPLCLFSCPFFLFRKSSLAHFFIRKSSLALVALAVLPARVVASSAVGSGSRGLLGHAVRRPSVSCVHGAKISWPSEIRPTKRGRVAVEAQGWYHESSVAIQYGLG